MAFQFPKLLEQVTEWVITTQTRNAMLVFHKEEGIWRDPNDFISLDSAQRTEDAGKFPDQCYLYDREVDAHDSFRSYFMMEGWDFALNVQWATSLDFAQKFRPLYGVSGILYGSGDNNIRWIKEKLKIEVIRGFTMMPTLSTSHDEPPYDFIVLSEADAVVLRFAIDDSKPED